MKRILLIFAVLTAFTFSARAEDFSVANSDGVTIYYNITDATALTVEVTFQGSSCNNEMYSGVVNIPSTVTYNGSTYSVTSIGSYAFYNCTSLSSITIPESVTSIGDEAFLGCTSLSSITLPDGVTSIGNYAFSGCTSLSSITIPDGVTSIGDGAFSGCTSLSSITIPDGVTSIGDGAFEGCTSLSSITIPDGVTSIGDGAFEGCTSLSSITLPDGVTSIGYGAFYGCTSLSSITIPEGVTSIGDGAFSGCSSLSSITLPDGVTLIGEFAFSGCTGLTSLHILNGDLVMSSNPLYGEYGINAANLDSLSIPASAFNDITTEYLDQSTNKLEYFNVVGGEISENGFSFISRQKSALKTLKMGNCTNTELPDGIFEEIRLLENLTFPMNLEKINSALLIDCHMLKSVEIGAKVTEIGDQAFEDCRMLNSVIFAEGSELSYIGNWAFYNCHELQSISIPEGVTEIGAAAFFNCTYLEDVTLPSTVQTIGNNAFALCSKLTKMTVDAVTPPSIDAKTFEDVDRSIPVYVPTLSVADYQAHEYWREFNIQGIGDAVTATETVKADEVDFIQNGNTISFTEEQQVSVYNINGVCVFSGVTRDLQLTTRGIYVVVTTSGATKVII